MDNDIAPDVTIPQYVSTILHLSPDILNKWVSTIVLDRHLHSIYKQLLPRLSDEVDAVEDNKWILKKVSGIPMLFVRKRNEGLRLCIPEGMHKDMLHIAHDNQAHAGIEHTYTTLRDHFYLRQMGSAVRSYVSNCPQCLTKKTMRHKPYGRLQIIEAPHKPFHTVTIDFIVKLPLSKSANDVYDTILTITDKLSRAVIFVAGKETWNAPEWADVFFDKVICRWGLPMVIISDRGSIFVSEIWSAIFKRMDVKILMSTVYHPQTDGQSEATNQYLQLLLRFFVTNVWMIGLDIFPRQSTLSTTRQIRLRTSFQMRSSLASIFVAPSTLSLSPTLITTLPIRSQLIDSWPVGMPRILQDMLPFTSPGIIIANIRTSNSRKDRWCSYDWEPGTR
jgi:hypothetical protein